MSDLWTAIFGAGPHSGPSAAEQIRDQSAAWEQFSHMMAKRRFYIFTIIPQPPGTLWHRLNNRTHRVEIRREG